MTTNLSRRSIARGAVWAVPAVTVASAAPALAASCTPRTVATTSAAEWTSTQLGCSSPTGDPEAHTVRYTVTNTGPQALPAGVEIDVVITITVLQGEEAQVQIEQKSDALDATITNDSTNDDSAGTTTLVATVKVVTASEIAVSSSATLTVLATYGFSTTTNDVAASESVTAQSPQTITNEATCLTTVATVSITGSSDGTSYTSPASGPIACNP